MINTLHSGAANQTEDYGEFDSFWWKFSDYVLQDGTICPAPNAVLTRYDPWSDFNIKGARDQSRFHQRPYLQLIQLAEAPDGEAALAWCRKFGLLGLFFAEAREITLYPRWKKGLPALRRFIRTSSGWICETWSDGTRSDVHLLPADQKPEGALVPKTYWSERFGEPGALLQKIRGELNHVRPGEYMGTFFPTVAESERETYPYPDPLSPEFWRLYSEPVETFLANAHAFANTVARVARIQPLSETLHQRAPNTAAGPQRHDASGGAGAAGAVPRAGWNLQKRVGNHFFDRRVRPDGAAGHTERPSRRV